MSCISVIEFHFEDRDIIEKTKIIAVIPARGGSKEIPRKNIKKLCGKPLIGYTIETALETDIFDRIIVSTDDLEIASVSEKYGVEVPFMRPKYLSGDNVPILPVIQHVINELKKEHYEPDIVTILQPTNPFRKSEDIVRAINKIIERNVDCVVSLSEVSQHPFRMRKMLYDRPLPLFAVGQKKLYAQRQDLPTIFMMDGAIQVSRTKTMMNSKNFYSEDVCGIEIDKISAFDIDTHFDFSIAETILKENHENQSGLF